MGNNSYTDANRVATLRTRALTGGWCTAIGLDMRGPQIDVIRTGQKRPLLRHFF
jgi:hypothetical protein